jgi:hypothetical protein
VGALDRLRAIGAEEEFRGLKPGSHCDASWCFLRGMHDLGRSAAVSRSAGVASVLNGEKKVL